MVYRHIYWGLLSVGPDKDNLITNAVKEKNYLVKIVTPRMYRTREEAEKDGFEYYFQVADDHPSLIGRHKDFDELMEKGFEGVEPGPYHDVILEEDWPRYRLIRLYEDPLKGLGSLEENAFRFGKPSGKDWYKIFPVMGIYHLKKAAYSVVALPDVEDGGEERCRYR